MSLSKEKYEQNTQRQFDRILVLLVLGLEMGTQSMHYNLLCENLFC